MNSEMNHSLEREAERLEKQIRINVIPKAELVSEQFGVTEIIKRKIGIDRFDVVAEFYVDSTRRLDYEAGNVVKHETVQTLGLTACDESRDILRFISTEEKNPNFYLPSNRRYSLTEDPFMYFINEQMLNEFDFRKYNKLAELALKISSGGLSTSQLRRDPSLGARSNNDHLMDGVYGNAHTALSELDHTFDGYTHLVNGANMAQIDTIVRDDNEVMRTIRIDGMPKSHYPKIWSKFDAVKVLEPKRPNEALEAVRAANRLIEESLLFPT